MLYYEHSCSTHDPNYNVSLMFEGLCLFNLNFALLFVINGISKGNQLQWFDITVIGMKQSETKLLFENHTWSKDNYYISQFGDYEIRFSKKTLGRKIINYHHCFRT